MTPTKFDIIAFGKRCVGRLSWYFTAGIQLVILNAKSGDLNLEIVHLRRKYTETHADNQVYGLREPPVPARNPSLPIRG